MELTASAGSWAYDAGGEMVRCRLALRAVSLTGERWVDWLSAQCCGFLFHGGHAAVPECALAEATALPDERTRGNSDRVCFFASQPLVVLAGHKLVAGEALVFNVWGALPPGLPPSHTGDLARIEYTMVVTARSMVPPSYGKSGWSRGPIARLFLPLRLLLCAPRGAPSTAIPTLALPALLTPSTRAAPPPLCTCTLESAEVTGSSLDAHIGAATRAETGWGSPVCESVDLDPELDPDLELESESEGGPELPGRGNGGGSGAAEVGRYLVVIDGSPLASVVLLDGATRRTGEVLRGSVRFDVGRYDTRPDAAGASGSGASSEGMQPGAAADPEARRIPPRCERLRLELRLQEVVTVDGRETTLSRLASSSEVSGGHVVCSSFELLVPPHWPPALVTPALQLRWFVNFRFDLCRRLANDSASTQLDWRLPVAVLPAVRAAARQPPFVLSETRAVTLADEAFSFAENR